MNLNHITQFSQTYILGEGMTLAAAAILGVLGAVILYLFIGGLKAKPIEPKQKNTTTGGDRPRLMRN